MNSSTEPESFANVNLAFSKQSAGYDAYDVSNPILQWMRARVYQHLFQFLKPGERVLEINAGTGIDAVRMARYGCYVHATDLSDGMIHCLNQKIITENLSDRITTEQLSYTELNHIASGPFDYVFSNFGGLNCAPDLRLITRHLTKLLKPGGFLTWVIMPKVALWELAAAFKGNFRYAFRRLHKHGTRAHLEGVYFPCYYYDVSDVRLALGDKYTLRKAEGLGALVPPPHRMDFASKRPSFYRWLQKTEERFADIWPFSRWADHVIVTFQKKI